MCPFCNVPNIYIFFLAVQTLEYNGDFDAIITCVELCSTIPKKDI